jgi:alanine racemase
MNFSELVSFLPYSKNQIADGDREILSLFYDTRLISNGRGGLFFAISSSRSDGHQFLEKAAQKGVNQWVISDEKWIPFLSQNNENNWILVENVVLALQKLAETHRKKFSIPVIGITGSNGKTIVKEWLGQMLAHRFFVCKSPKSFNSQIGVPLSVWNLKPGHGLGIFEAGISKSGEMAHLQAVIQPNLGILTSLGAAHSEGFESENQKWKEKLSLFSNCPLLILSQNLFESHKSLLQSTLHQTKWVTWRWKPMENGQFEFQKEEVAIPFSLPYSDQASMENLGNVLAMGMHLGLTASEIQENLKNLSLPQMRLSLKEGIHGNQIIDDSYTNDLVGLEAALQFARLQRKENQNLVLIISDLEETGLSPKEISDQVYSLCQTYQVTELASMGSQFQDLPISELCRHQTFESLESFVDRRLDKKWSNSILLVKGARKFHFENLVKILQKKVHGTRLEINLDTMVANLNFYKGQLPKGTGIIAMVKALGYGSGGEEIARLLEFHRIDYLAVAYADEGIKLREAGISLPIMVLNPMPEALDSILNFQLEPEIYNFRILGEWLEACKGRDRLPPIHLKIDTGMHRLGFFNADLPRLVAILNEEKNQKLASVFSHMAAADEEKHQEYSLQQIKLFEEACDYLKTHLAQNQNFKRHLLNSAGILRFPQAAYDWVRLGIGLYGIEVNSWFQNQLQPVSTLKTTISQIKKLKARETVGYGRKGVLDRDSEIATIAIGYADGFRRDFSGGKAKVKVRNQWVPVVGNVCMDMSMIDVTNLMAEEGDEVIIFDDAESILKLSEVAQTIPYELLTGIGQRVKRIFYRE